MGGVSTTKREEHSSESVTTFSVGRRFKGRLYFILVVFALIYTVFVCRLVWFGTYGGKIEEAQGPRPQISTARPDILDRNGVLLATDIRTYSLFAQPRRIINKKETVNLLQRALPLLDFKNLKKKLSSKANFVWIARELSLKQKEIIMALGIPGIGFRTESHRFYPMGASLVHVLGQVDIDNNGVSGIEKYLDQSGLQALRAYGLTANAALKPVSLTIDSRVQAIVHDELKEALTKYSAIGAGAVVLNIHTGEVVALSSLPDFSPNESVSAGNPARFNRMVSGLYEMGSIIKTFTTAMALESGVFTLDSLVDASHPIQIIPGQVIHDMHGKNRPLHVWEVFIYSSNIGSANEALTIGAEAMKAYFERFGLLSHLQTELPETAHPVSPNPWRRVHAMTISFGHGMMTTPLQTAVAGAALLNGGKWVAPSFIKGHEKKAMREAHAVISAQTSLALRYLYQLNVQIGSGRNAAIAGYRVGGKTGTAEKVVKGKYSRDKRFNSFIAAFPMDNPQYLILTIVDEPKPEAGAVYATAAYNVARIASNIIKRSAFFLGVKPDFAKEKIKLLNRDDKRS